MAATDPTTLPAKVAENRARMAAALGVRPDRFVTAYQIHSPDVVTIDEPWAAERAPARRCDRDPRARTWRSGSPPPTAARSCSRTMRARVIGVAHAGWRGAVTGVLEATIAAMEACGADRRNIMAALGPMIRQPNYEVGPEFVARFTAADTANQRFFKPSARARHALFDLPGYIAARLAGAGIDRVEDLGSVHLWGCGALLQLSALDPSRRDRLWAARQRDRAQRLNRLTRLWLFGHRPRRKSTVPINQGDTRRSGPSGPAENV